MRADALQHLLQSVPDPRHRNAASHLRAGTAWEQQALPPRQWTYTACAGRLVELSGDHAGPLLSLAFTLVADAQRAGEPVAWIQAADSTFFPPDVARNGVDLDTLAVVRLDSIPARVRAAVRLLRAGAFGLVGLDLSPAAPVHAAAAKPEAGTTADVTAPFPVPDNTHPADPSSPFGLPRGPAADSLALHASPRIPAALLGQFAQLAQQHNAAVCCLTAKRADWASLGSLVSLRGEVLRRRTGEDRFACTLHVLKDKRNGPGWTHEETLHGPPGLS